MGRSEYLKKCESSPAPAAAVVERPAKEAKTAGTSLASLLGMVRQEASAEEAGRKEWKPVWARNTTESQASSGGITEEQQEALTKLHADEEREAARKREIRKQIAEEFAQA